MTPDQIVKAADRYIGILKAKCIEPKNWPPERPCPPHPSALAHCYWMAEKLKTFVAEKPAKAERWICFIQGTLWAIHGFSIAEFKDDNRGEP